MVPVVLTNVAASIFQITVPAKSLYKCTTVVLRGCCCRNAEASKSAASTPNAAEEMRHYNQRVLNDANKRLITPVKKQPF